MCLPLLEGSLHAYNLGYLSGRASTGHGHNLNKVAYPAASCLKYCFCLWKSRGCRAAEQRDSIFGRPHKRIKITTSEPLQVIRRGITVSVRSFVLSVYFSFKG